MAAISPGTGEGIFVSASTGNSVTLRNLSIRNNANAYYGMTIYGQGYTLHIEHCVVSGFGESGVMVMAGGTAINFYLDDTIIRDNHVYGVWLEENVTASISNSHILNSIVGVAEMSGGANLAMTNSEVSGSATGFAIDNSTTPSSTASIANSVVANNTQGVLASGAGAAITLSNVSLFNNTTAGIVILNGGVVNSFRNNANTGMGTPSKLFPLQ